MPFKRFLSTAFLAAAAATSGGCFVEEAATAARDHYEETLEFRPGGTFRLENTNGKVVVEGWDRDTVSIEAEKGAPSRRMLDDIEIDIEQTGDLIEVKTRLSRRRSLFGARGKVDYMIRVPENAQVEVETVNGTVQVDRVRGRVNASTINGSVEIADVSGEVEARTINGSIRASYLEAGGGSHRFSTTNGGVRVQLPPDVSGDFEARTVNGSIQTDFPLEVSGRPGRRLHGQLGDGKGRFRISTVNGSVKIQKL